METKKLTQTQQLVFDFLSKEKNQNCNAELVTSCLTDLTKLTILKTLKGLTDKGLIVKSTTTPPTYSKAEVGGIDNNSEEKNNKKQESEVSLNNSRDTSKYKFNGELYGKGRLVLAIVKQFVADNPKITVTKLREAFPEDLNKRYGLFQTLERAKENSVDRDRYFMKPADLIKVAGNKKVAVCNQFGSHNLPLAHFKSLGFVIK